MRLFFDEDAGTGVAQAIPMLGMLPASDVAWVRRIWPKRNFPDSIQDETWIPWAAKYGFIVISRNTAIIESDSQRQLVADSGLGIVFVPQHISALELFNLVQRRWTFLRDLFTKEPRPFAYHIPLAGDPRRDPAIPLDYPTQTRASLMQTLSANIRALSEVQPAEDLVLPTSPTKTLAEGWKPFDGFLEAVPLAEQDTSDPPPPAAP